MSVPEAIVGQQVASAKSSIKGLDFRRTVTAFGVVCAVCAKLVRASARPIKQVFGDLEGRFRYSSVFRPAESTGDKLT